VQRLIARYARPKPALESAPAPGADADEAAPQALLWCDLGGRRLRRDLVRRLRRQKVTVEVLPARLFAPRRPEPRLWTRAERAHRRLSWAARLARNALPAGIVTSRVTLCGIPPQLAEFLGLPASPAR